MNWFQSQSVVLQAFLAGLFTWGCTIIGSAIVFFFKHISRKLLDIMMGFAAGVMIAASFWSLLQPSIEYAEASYGSLAWFPAAIGFLAGGFFLRLIDALVPHLHMSKEIEEAESIHTPREKKLSKTTLLFLAITIHNFPEGLAVGVAFGALASNPSPEAFIGAVGLAIGIGLQNIPEGAALTENGIVFVMPSGICHWQRPGVLEKTSTEERKEIRSEERRVGKECRSRWSPYH